MNPPPCILFSAGSNIRSQWSPYVLPEYHQTWLDLKKKHRLSDEMMVSLFRTIKVVDKYGPGHFLRDLTIYPGPIDRALSLIILKDVGNVEDLQTLFETLEGYSARWKSLPDNPRGSHSLSYSNDDQIVLVFYDHILKKPRREFTEGLISELRRAISPNRDGQRCILHINGLPLLRGLEEVELSGGPRRRSEPDSYR